MFRLLLGKRWPLRTRGQIERGNWTLSKDLGRERGILREKNKKKREKAIPEETSNLWRDMGNIVCHPVASPVLELPGATVVPGATPVVPETERV